MAGLELKIIGDGSDAVRAVEDIGEALQDVVDDMTDVNRAGEKTETELEQNFRAIARAAKKAGDDSGDDLKKGFREGTDTIKQEGLSSGKEAAASFSGGFDDITSLLQEVAANAFEGFGPAGAAGGLLAAAGIGIATALFSQAEERRQALEEKASDLAAAYIEAGSTVLSELAIAGRVGDIITSTDPQDKADVEDLTTALGDRALALRVLAGDTGALATAQGILKQKQDTLNDQGYLTSSGKRKTALSEEADKVKTLNRILGDQKGVQDKAKQSANDYSDTLLQIVKDADSATREVDEFGNVLYTLPSGEQVVIDAETGKATGDVKTFKGDVEKIPDQHVTNVRAQVTLDTRAITDYRPPMVYVPWKYQTTPSGRQPI